MVENLYNFEKVLKHISVNEDIFKPNLTTKLSIEAAQDELKNNFSILDLGCGSGVIGIALMKNFPDVVLFNIWATSESAGPIDIIGRLEFK